MHSMHPNGAKDGQVGALALGPAGSAGLCLENVPH
jgi:hypothetical protein